MNSLKSFSLNFVLTKYCLNFVFHSSMENLLQNYNGFKDFKRAAVVELVLRLFNKISQSISWRNKCNFIKGKYFCFLFKCGFNRTLDFFKKKEKICCKYIPNNINVYSCIMRWGTYWSRIFFLFIIFFCLRKIKSMFLAKKLLSYSRKISINFQKFCYRKAPSIVMLFFHFSTIHLFWAKRREPRHKSWIHSSTMYNKTDAFNDPLGQTHSHASSEQCFLLFCFSRFEKWGQHVRKHDAYRPWLWVGRVDQQDRCLQWSTRSATLSLQISFLCYYEFYWQRDGRTIYMKIIGPVGLPSGSIFIKV